MLVSRHRVLSALAASVFLAASCGGGEPEAAATPEPTPAPALEPVEGASCEPQTGGNRDASMFLESVSMAPQNGHDRLVFAFKARGQDTSLPFYSIRPVEPPLLEEPTGNELEVDGRAHLQVVFWATGIDDSDPENPRAVYTGTRSQKPGDTHLIRELREAGDFENTMTWYVGLDQEACVRPSSTSSPVRLVFDIGVPE